MDLILGTDPDGDRLGLVVKEKDGSFTVLNGNETGSLFAEFILRKTEDVLTGFKYIGDKIKEYEQEGASFLFGLEESYGYLKGTYARDKDAVVAAMLAVELAAECKAEGITLTEHIEWVKTQWKRNKLLFTLNIRTKKRRKCFFFGVFK